MRPGRSVLGFILANVGMWAVMMAVMVIVPDMLGNGLSSSPSNTPPPYDRARFPNVTIQDNVVAEHRLVTEGFGVSRIALVVGWSMGAQQTFQWAASHPDIGMMITFAMM